MKPNPNEKLLSVPGAEVAWIDISFFRKKWQQMSPLIVPSDKEIGRKIKKWFSLISTAQALTNEVNYDFHCSKSLYPGFRPSGYGRAIIIDTEFGLFDLKGVGVAPDRMPQIDPFRTGLLDLPEAVLEVCVQRYVDRLIEDRNVSTTKCVAIILLPIYMRSKFSGEGRIRCALLVRESYPRVALSQKSPIFLDNITEYMVHIENELRQGGLTTTSPLNTIKLIERDGAITAFSNKEKCADIVSTKLSKFVYQEGLRVPCTFDIANIQFGIEPKSTTFHLVDFEAYRFQSKFKNHLIVADSWDDQIYMRMVSANGARLVKRPRITKTVSSAFSTEKFKLENRKVLGADIVETKQIAGRVFQMLSRTDNAAKICNFVNRQIIGCDKDLM